VGDGAELRGTRGTRYMLTPTTLVFRGFGATEGPDDERIQGNYGKVVLRAAFFLKDLLRREWLRALRNLRARGKRISPERGWISKQISDGMSGGFDHPDLD